MARPVTVTIPHDIGRENARQRIRDGFGKLKSELSGGLPFSFDENWITEDQLAFQAKGLGQKVTGKIDIFPEHVRIEAMLPSALASLAEIITGRLEKKGQLLLEKK